MQTANANPLAALHSQLMQLPMAYPAFGLQPQIHPAFLHTPYAASPLTYRPAKAVGKSFTIDAILGRDEDRPVKNARFESAHPYMPSIANMGFRNALNMKGKIKLKFLIFKIYFHENKSSNLTMNDKAVKKLISLVVLFRSLKKLKS